MADSAWQCRAPAGALEKCDRLRRAFENADALFAQRSHQPVMTNECRLRVPTAGRQVLVEFALALKAQPVDLDRLVAAVDEGDAGVLFRRPRCEVGLGRADWAEAR